MKSWVEGIDYFIIVQSQNEDKTSHKSMYWQNNMMQ